ncbi:MAG: hypothetical protein MPW17_13875 [Candidatus Manganitrophus sp.]|nr:hypothetical protein [Candidatus Manganitrophus sp.]MDC4227394.1 hypothetical protein [Candidatus Manganitrophus sp.]WDT69850.1 MAG: hypothetical protein MPW17_13875 [Candidatus Manganitrophus sp.]
MLSERGPFEAGRLVDIIKKVLPKGRALPEEEWRVRHRAILLLTWLHAAGLPLFGIYQGFGIVQSFAEGGDCRRRACSDLGQDQPQRPIGGR